MANKTKGYKDARSLEGMNSVTFYPEAPVFGKNDIDEVPEEHRQRCVLVSWPIGGPERVFTESEVLAMVNAMVEQGANLKNLHGGIYKATATSTIREIAERHGIVLDPA